MAIMEVLKQHSKVMFVLFRFRYEALKPQDAPIYGGASLFL